MLSTKFKSGKVKDLVVAEKAMRRVVEEECVFVIPGGLGEVKDWVLELYYDTSLGNLERSNSTKAFILILKGKEDRCTAISWNSSKISRVANNILEAETLACSAAMDEAIAVKEMLEEIFRLMRNSIPVVAKVDSNSLDDAIILMSVVENKRLRRDIARIKENLETRKVNGLCWVPGAKMLADVMTKQGVNPARIQALMRSGKWSN